MKVRKLQQKLKWTKCAAFAMAVAAMGGSAQADDCSFDSQLPGCFQINARVRRPDNSTAPAGVLWINQQAYSAVGSNPATHQLEASQLFLEVRPQGQQDAGGVYVLEPATRQELGRIGELSRTSLGQAQGMWQFNFDSSLSLQYLTPFQIDYWICTDGITAGHLEPMHAVVTRITLSNGHDVKQVLEARKYEQGFVTDTHPPKPACGNQGAATSE